MSDLPRLELSLHLAQSLQDKTRLGRGCGLDAVVELSMSKKDYSECYAAFPKEGPAEHLGGPLPAACAYPRDNLARTPKHGPLRNGDSFIIIIIRQLFQTSPETPLPTVLPPILLALDSCTCSAGML
jgi:hypothetical protein